MLIVDQNEMNPYLNPYNAAEAEDEARGARQGVPTDLKDPERPGRD
jgi:hypothetical protein